MPEGGNKRPRRSSGGLAHNPYTPKLRRFALGGDWWTTAEDLIHFVKIHAPSLRVLDLAEMSLKGTWVEALAAIAELTRGRLKYISITDPSEHPKGNFELSEPNLGELEADGKVCFDCTTKFDDSDDDDSDDETSDDSSDED